MNQALGLIAMTSLYLSGKNCLNPMERFSCLLLGIGLLGLPFAGLGRRLIIPRHLTLTKKERIICILERLEFMQVMVNGKLQDMLLMPSALSKTQIRNPLRNFFCPCS